MTQGDGRGTDAPMPARRPSPLPLLGILAGGAAWAVAVVLVIAGGGGLALFLGAIAVPLSYALGMMAWRLVLGAWLGARAGRALVRGGGRGERVRAELEQEVEAIRAAGPRRLPGAWVFAVAGAAVGIPVGALIALVAPGGGAPAGALIAAGCVVTGILLGRLVRAGAMPLGDE